MKRYFFVLLLFISLAVSALAQGAPPITFTEVDGSPRKTAPTKIIVSNGTLTCVGSTCTITTGGGGGGTPGGSNTQLQYNNAGSFGGISGGTSDGTNVTFGTANLRATSPRFTTALLDSNGNPLVSLVATGSATNNLSFANSTTNNAPVISVVGPDTDIGLTFSPKGGGSNIFTKNILFNVGSAGTDNLIYLISTGQGAVDGSLGFFAAGAGSGGSAQGPYFLARGNNFSASAGQRGTVFFVGGDPSSPTGSEGTIRFLAGGEAERLRINRDGTIQLFPIALGSLGTPTDGAEAYCSDCNVNTDPCTSGGTGAKAIRLNGRWYCP